MKYLTDAVGDTFNYAVDKTGNVAENLFERTEQTLSGVFEYMSNGFVQVGIIVVILAVLGLFSYYFIRSHLLSDDDDEYDNSVQYRSNDSILLYQTPQNFHARENMKQSLISDDIYSEF